MENLSANIEKLPCFAIIGKPGLRFFMCSLSITQAILAKLTPTIQLVAHTLFCGRILLDILETLWLANSE